MLNSKISWCDDTWNLWWGCQKVSPACKFCYADTLSKRTGADLWGPPATTDRRLVKSAWTNLAKISKTALETGPRRRVFVSSMSDFMELLPDPKFHAINDARRDAFAKFEYYGWLDFLILTKRPENIKAIVPRHWLTHWPSNVVIGASAENQAELEKRLPHLLEIPARRFLSCEPLLGAIDLDAGIAAALGVDIPSSPDFAQWGGASSLIHWIIAGGESGLAHGTRVMNPEYPRQLRDWCFANNVPFLFKQWGRYIPVRTGGLNILAIDSANNRVRCVFDGKDRWAYLVDGDPLHLYVDMLTEKDDDRLDGKRHHEFYREDAEITTIRND